MSAGIVEVLHRLRSAELVRMFDHEQAATNAEDSGDTVIHQAIAAALRYSIEQLEREIRRELGAFAEDGP